MGAYGGSNSIHSFLIFLFVSLHFWLSLSPKSDSQAENCSRPNLYLMQSVKQISIPIIFYYTYWIKYTIIMKYYHQGSSPSVHLRVVYLVSEVLFCNIFQLYLLLEIVFQVVLVHTGMGHHTWFSINSRLSNNNNNNYYYYYYHTLSSILKFN